MSELLSPASPAQDPGPAVRPDTTSRRPRAEPDGRPPRPAHSRETKRNRRSQDRGTRPLTGSIEGRTTGASALACCPIVDIDAHYRGKGHRDRKTGHLATDFSRKTSSASGERGGDSELHGAGSRTASFQFGPRHDVTKHRTRTTLTSAAHDASHDRVDRPNAIVSGALPCRDVPLHSLHRLYTDMTITPITPITTAGGANSAPPPTPRALLVNVAQAAQILCVSRSSIYQLIWTDQLIPIRIGRSVRFSLEQLERFVAVSRVGEAEVEFPGTA